MWSPWRELRKQADVVFGLGRLPASTGGGVLYRDSEGAVTLLEADLSRVERKVALAHELVHLERGGVVDGSGLPETWDVVVLREERRVDRIVAERMIPLEDLGDSLEQLDAPVTAFDVAEHFDVTEDIARVACAQAIADGLLGDRPRLAG